MVVHNGPTPVYLGAIRDRVVYICPFNISGKIAVEDHCLSQTLDVQQEEKWYQSYMRHQIL